MVLVRSNEKYRAEDRFVKDVDDQKTRVVDGSRGGDDIISLVLSA